jgi:nucleotide-binding universal stress UspA family protein
VRILVPYDGTPLTRTAIHEACRILTPLDELIILAAVVVPRHVTIDAPAGDVWKQTCRAEVSLAHAREIVARATHAGDALHCVRVQSGSRVTAIVAGALFYGADTILLAERAGVRGRVAALFGPTAAILRDAPCDVRILYAANPHHTRRACDLRGMIDVHIAPPTAGPWHGEMDDESAHTYSARDDEGKSAYAD